MEPDHFERAERSRERAERMGDDAYDRGIDEKGSTMTTNCCLVCGRGLLTGARSEVCPKCKSKLPVLWQAARAALEAEKARHAATTKKLIEAEEKIEKYEGEFDPEGELDELKDDLKRAKQEAVDWEQEADEAKEKQAELEACIANTAGYDARFLLALDLLGMTEAEFDRSKRVSDAKQMNVEWVLLDGRF